MSDISTTFAENNQGLTPLTGISPNMTPPPMPFSVFSPPPHAGIQPENDPPHELLTPPPNDHGGVENLSRGVADSTQNLMGGVRLPAVFLSRGGSVYQENSHGGGQKEPKNCQGGKPINLQSFTYDPFDPDANDIERKFRRYHDTLISNRRRMAGAKVITHGYGHDAAIELVGGALGDHDWVHIDQLMVNSMRNDLIAYVRKGRQAEADHLRRRLVSWSHAQPDFAAMRDRLGVCVEKWKVGQAKVAVDGFGADQLANALEWIAKFQAEGMQITNELGLLRPWLLEDVTLPWL